MFEYTDKTYISFYCLSFFDEALSVVYILYIYSTVYYMYILYVIRIAKLTMRTCVCVGNDFYIIYHIFENNKTKAIKIMFLILKIRVSVINQDEQCSGKVLT